MRLIKNINNKNLAFQTTHMISTDDSCDFHGFWANISKKYISIEPEPAVLSIKIIDIDKYLTKEVPEGKLHNNISWRRL